MHDTGKEAVGAAFDEQAMRHAQHMTWQAIDAIAARMTPGLAQSAAGRIAHDILNDMSMERVWHPVLVRFGSNTLKTFKQPPEDDPILGENDIFYIDLGVVWQGHEGDAGATFCTGTDPGMSACAQAAKDLFERVRQHWAEQRVTGPALYDYAHEQARAMGWRLNLDVKGHRVSDFPHAIYKAGQLGAYPGFPSPGLWILEIQIAHPTRPFGAFYEDLLA